MFQYCCPNPCGILISLSVCHCHYHMSERLDIIYIINNINQYYTFVGDHVFTDTILVAGSFASVVLAQRKKMKDHPFSIPKYNCKLLESTNRITFPQLKDSFTDKQCHNSPTQSKHSLGLLKSNSQYAGLNFYL